MASGLRNYQGGPVVKGNHMSQGWIIGLLGIWLVAASFLYPYRLFYAGSDFLAGLAIAVSGYTMLREKTWQGWVALFLGIWLVVSIFIPVLRVRPGAYWNSIGSGIIAIIAGFLSINRPPRPPADASTREKPPGSPTF